MGVTGYDIMMLEGLMKTSKPSSVVELGAQNNYSFIPAYEHRNVKFPYMRSWYDSLGIDYDSVDWTGENGSRIIDLSKGDTEDDLFVQRDWVTDFGTSEHICGKDGKFSWEAIFNCWFFKFNICRVGGLIISENPMTGNWPGHGASYYTHNFYVHLARIADLKILSLGNVAALGNEIDGWNVLCVMEKTGEHFPLLEEFQKLDLRTA
jgi:hypothetical protein